LQVAAGVSILGLVAWGCFTYTSVAESSEHGSAMAKDQQLEQQLWGVQSPLYGASYIWDNPAQRAIEAQKQGCSRMSNSWSIVDIQYHCGQDEVAFRYNKFKGVDYWICYRCLAAYPESPPPPPPPPPPTGVPIALPESCFSATVKEMNKIDHGSVMCSQAPPSMDCGITQDGLPKRLFKGMKCCVC